LQIDKTISKENGYDLLLEKFLILPWGLNSPA
jgi:hypothetical protein